MSNASSAIPRPKPPMRKVSDDSSAYCTAVKRLLTMPERYATKAAPAIPISALGGDPEPFEHDEENRARAGGGGPAEHSGIAVDVERLTCDPAPQAADEEGQR